MLPIVLLLSGVAAIAQTPSAATQNPAPVPADLAELASRVETAHRPQGSVAPVTALRADFEVHLLDPSAPQKGQADLAVQLLEWARPNTKKPVTLIRYELGDAGTRVVRGRDSEGPWHSVQGAPVDLTSADYVEDLATFQRHSNVAKQLVRFLSPGDALRSLQQPSAVTAEDLVIERGTKVPCVTIEGDMASFPLVHKARDDGPVHVRFFVDRANGHLVALDVWPQSAGKPDPLQGERIVLLDLRLREGILVPHRLRHLFRDPEGRLRPNSEAVMMKLELRPLLAPADFERKKAVLPSQPGPPKKG
jgi:hypothetical protein